MVDENVIPSMIHMTKMKKDHSNGDEIQHLFQTETSIENKFFTMYK